MAFVINVALDVGQPVHYITKCQGVPDDTGLITVRSSEVAEVRTVTHENETSIVYLVLEKQTIVQVPEEDAFATLTQATNELNARLSTTPQ